MKNHIKSRITLAAFKNRQIRIYTLQSACDYNNIFISCGLLYYIQPQMQKHGLVFLYTQSCSIDLFPTELSSWYLFPSFPAAWSYLQIPIYASRLFSLFLTCVPLFLLYFSAFIPFSGFPTNLGIYHCADDNIVQLLLIYF